MRPSQSNSRQSLIQALKRFIAFDTVSTRGSSGFARHVGALLRRSGFRVSFQKCRIKGETFMNAVAVKGPRGRKPRLMLCAHLDTVPAGAPSQWTRTGKNPWRAVFRANRLYGLGAADDKASLLAIVNAAAGFSSSLLKHPLMVVATFGEENGMRGAMHFTRVWKGPKPQAVIAGEPTSLEITYRHKGIGAIEIHLKRARGVSLAAKNKTLKIRFRGRQGHSSRPHLADNALVKAIAYAKRKIHEDPRTVLLSLEGGCAANIIPGEASATFGSTAGGFRKHSGKAERTIPFSHASIDCYDAVQSVVKPLQKHLDRTFFPPALTSNFGVASTCGCLTTLVFDFRLLPGQSLASIHRRLRTELSKRLKRYPGLKWRTEIERNNPPLGLNRNHRFVRFTKTLLRQNNLPVRLNVKPSCTEAGIYCRWKVPAVVFGPGESTGNIHAPNESVRIREIEKAIQFYRSAIEAVCVRGKPCT